MADGPGGRPPKYCPEMCDRIVALMREGMSITEAACHMDVRRETLYAWAKDADKPEFSNAFSKAIALSQAWWERQARENLVTREFQTSLWSFNMKNRFKWTDRQEVQQDVNAKVSIQVVDRFTPGPSDDPDTV